MRRIGSCQCSACIFWGLWHFGVWIPMPLVLSLTIAGTPITSWFEGCPPGLLEPSLTCSHWEKCLGTLDLPGGSPWPVIDRCWHINTPTSLALVRKTLRCGLGYSITFRSLAELTSNYLPPDLCLLPHLLVCLPFFSPYFPTVFIVFLKILPIKSLLQESWSQGLVLKEAKNLFK